LMVKAEREGITLAEMKASWGPQDRISRYLDPDRKMFERHKAEEALRETAAIEIKARKARDEREGSWRGMA